MKSEKYKGDKTMLCMFCVDHLKRAPWVSKRTLVLKGLKPRKAWNHYCNEHRHLLSENHFVNVYVHLPVFSMFANLMKDPILLHINRQVQTELSLILSKM